ncbi:beta-fructofuranosidase, insoluble isoenzyme 1-like [Olea europaea var. sylvestris]|uniref:beta-fructofuranosidase, insoluble isoenzyme 1-like n=1 Tax=Olea europaea var. sylvestris TaxID=158386 RepID=UPI000C1D01DE|nr:beta-fructofuranosidase, insoluble isoenzyme 1-like [Olea europaea var. sylvestris]
MPDYKFLWVFAVYLFCFLAFNNGVVEASHKEYLHLQSVSRVNVKQVHRTAYHFQPQRNWINGLYFLSFLSMQHKDFHMSTSQLKNLWSISACRISAKHWKDLNFSEAIIKYHINLSIVIAHLYRSRDFLHWVKAKHPLHSVAGTGNWECPDFFPVSVQGTNGLDTSVMGENVKHVLKVSLDVTRYEYYTLGMYDTTKDRYIPDKDMVDGWKGLRYDYGNFYASKSFFDPAKNRRILWGWANESDAVIDDIRKGWAGIQVIPRTIVLDPNGKQLLQWPIEEIQALRGKKVEVRDKKLEKGERIEIKGITAAQADVEIIFTFESLDKAETFDPSWDRYDGQNLCSQKGSTVQGGVGPFGLLTLATENLEEYTPVFFRIFKDQEKHLVLMCSDASRSSLYNETGTYRPSFAGFVDVDLSHKKLSLRSLIDHSVVESFGARGKTCITSRVYPTLAIYDNTHLYAFNNGTETIKIETLKAWSMNKPNLMNH